MDGAERSSILMATAALVIALVSGALTAGTQGVALIAAIKAVHHHTTAVVYHHVLKPVGHGVKKVAQ
jgi:hypothetical protein